MSVVWISPLTGTSDLEPDLVAEMLRRHITPDDRVEHLRSRAGPYGLMIFGFMMADTPQQAQTTLRNLTQKTITSEPELRLWRII